MDRPKMGDLQWKGSRNNEIRIEKKIFAAQDMEDDELSSKERNESKEIERRKDRQAICRAISSFIFLFSGLQKHLLDFLPIFF